MLNSKAWQSLLLFSFLTTVLCRIIAGEISGRRPDACAAPSGRQAGSQKAAGEDAPADTAAQTAAPGDALRPEPLESGIHLPGRARARGGLHHEGAGDTAAAGALRVHPVQDRLHARLEVGEAGQQQQEGRAAGAARDVPAASGRPGPSGHLRALRDDQREEGAQGRAYESVGGQREGLILSRCFGRVMVFVLCYLTHFKEDLVYFR